MNAADLVLVDGHNLAWIAATGTPASVSSRDRSRDLTGVFMFFALLRKAIRENIPGAPEVLVVFDGEQGSAGRKAIDPGYKANRTEETPLPVRSLPDIKRGLDSLGLPWTEIDAHEADDVIASAARHAEGRRRLVLSRDRDFYQLLSDQVHVLNTSRPAGHRIITAEEVTRRFQVTPDQWCDRAALVGDVSDNIPGVRGVGTVTAARLLADCLHLEDLPGSGRLRGRTGEAILTSWRHVLTWRGIARAVDTIELPAWPTGRPTPEIPKAAEVIEALNLW